MQHHNTYRHFIRGLIRFIVYSLAFFIFSLVIWVTNNFGQPSLEQLLYHAQFGYTGLLDTDSAIIKSFLCWCTVLPIAGAILLVGFEYSILLYLIKRYSDLRPHHLNSKSIRVFYWFIGHRAPLYLIFLACAYFSFNFSLLDFIHNQYGKDYFAGHYLNPKNVQVKPVKPKNLVLIYVESLEDSYKQPALFGKNLLSSLDSLPGGSFTSYRPAPGSWWTIAGITATQCGLPLKSISLYDGNDQGQVIKQFLPNAICLGDILHQAGYQNVYMGGDALNFSGKGLFFKNHHYNEVLGREELKTQLINPEFNYWGLYDDDLLRLAKEKLLALREAGKPYNLTITTIDTHGPDGHLSRYCKSRGAASFESIVTCTSDQVSEFVLFMKKNDFLKDTNIVIIGDHLAMENPVYAKLNKIKKRLIFNKFISESKIKKNRDEIIPFDVFPTILDFIGFKIEGGKLGLGVTAISNENLSSKLLNYEDMNANLLNKSDKYLELWNVNK